eukprot:18204_1
MTSLLELDHEMEHLEPRSWDEHSKHKVKAKIYDNRTVKSNFKKKYERNQHEVKSDALMDGVKRTKHKIKKKQQKLIFENNCYFGDTSTADIDPSSSDYDFYDDFPYYDAKQKRIIYDYYSYQSSIYDNYDNIDYIDSTDYA